MTYKPGVRVCGKKLLILPDAVEEKSAGGIILNTNPDKEQHGVVKGLVIDVGSGCWSDQTPAQPWCKVGDRIVFGKFRGNFHDGDDGLKYRIISDLDVIGVLVDEDELQKLSNLGEVI